MNLSKSLEENYNHIKTDFVDCSDFLIRKAKTGNREFLIMVCDGLIDSLQLSQMVVSPILRCDEIDIDTIKKSITNSVELNEAETFADCYYYVMSGFAVVLVETNLDSAKTNSISPLFIKNNALSNPLFS